MRSPDSDWAQSFTNQKNARCGERGVSMAILLSVLICACLVVLVVALMSGPDGGYGDDT